MTKAQQQDAAAASELEQVTKGLQEVRGRVEQRRADSQAQTSQGAVVKALMAAKTSKDVPGILGRLGEAAQWAKRPEKFFCKAPEQPCTSTCMISVCNPAGMPGQNNSMPEFDDAHARHTRRACSNQQCMLSVLSALHWFMQLLKPMQSF